MAFTDVTWRGLDGWIDRLSAAGLIQMSVGTALAPVINRGMSSASTATPVQTGDLQRGWTEDSASLGRLPVGEGGFYNDVEYAADVDARRGMLGVGADEARAAMPEAMRELGKAIGRRWE